MNRYLYAIFGALFLAGLAGAWIWYSNVTAPQANTNTSSNPSLPGSDTYIPYPSTSQTGTTPAESTQDEKAVQDTYRAALAVDNADNITLGKTVLSGKYALQAWTGARTGGQALLAFDSSQNKWIIVDPGGGVWSIEGLVSMGVPKNNAIVLVARAR